MKSGDAKAPLNIYKKMGLIAICIAALTFVVYLPSLKSGFVNWDDNGYIYENPYLKGPDADFLGWMFQSLYLSNWHPLTWLSYAIDYSVWGLDPKGYHLTNILLHSLNTFLVVLLILRLFGMASTGENSEGRILFSAALAGVVFGLHPLHVESVAWVSERKDVLYALFYILSVYFYLGYTASATKKRKTLCYSLCLVSFALSLMSKPMAVTLPAALLITDLYFGRHKKNLLKVTVYEKLPFYALSAISAVLAVLAQKTGGALVSVEALPFPNRLALAFDALWTYLYKTVIPAGLVNFYPIPPAVSFSNLKYAGSFLLIIIISSLCLLLWKKRPVFIASWAYYVVSLLPVLGIIQIGSQARADRYMYLPILGPLIVLGASGSWLRDKAGKRKMYLALLPVFLAVLLSALTLKQTAIWKDSTTLWSSVIRQYPENPIAYRYRADAYAEYKMFGRAVEDYSRAVSLKIDYVEAYNNRAAVYFLTGNYRKAVADFTMAISAGTGENKMLYYNRAQAYGALGAHGQAIEDYRESARLGHKPAQDYLTSRVIAW